MEEEKIFKYKGKDFYIRDIVESIRQSGVKEGDTIFVHSNVSVFGKPVTYDKEFFLGVLIKAIKESVGEKGTIIMPTFSYSCCEKDIMVGVFFMVGFPTETKKEAMETLNFIKKLDKITMPYLFGVKFYPGTQLYKIAEEMGIMDSNQKQNIFRPYHEMGTHKTDKMTEEDFKFLFITYMLEIFLNKDRLRNALKVQRKYLSNEEVSMVYSTFLNKKIDSPEKIFQLTNETKDNKK